MTLAPASASVDDTRFIDPAELAPHVPAPAAPVGAPAAREPRTVWGVDLVGLHARYWASLGVQVVRQGEPSAQLVKHAELYLLTDPRSLPLFDLADLMPHLNWLRPQALFVRLHDERRLGYRERALVDGSDRFVRFQRVYGSADRLARVVLTPEREVALLWQKAPSPQAGWRRLRRGVRREERVTLSSDGRVYDRTSDEELALFVHDLVGRWRRPDATIARPAMPRANATGDVWVDPTARVDSGARLIGSVWVGAGRHVEAGSVVVGPVVLWDAPDQRPAAEALSWLQIEPAPSNPASIDVPEIRTAGLGYRAAKRAFDVLFSLAALLGTVPLWPLIMLAIWWEDGRPFFFVHRRETVGGRPFGCIKFRSMRKDAEAKAAQLGKANVSDGAHVYVPNDDRVTPIGKVLRKTNLDELPQFWNVLVGDMSVVGPRPSPHKENQYCPPWREARLSVRPGITGLWQISRTRKAGEDFQEWIRYDLEYVERQGFWLDLRIVAKTVQQIVRKGTRS